MILSRNAVRKEEEEKCYKKKQNDTRRLLERERELRQKEKGKAIMYRRAKGQSREYWPKEEEGCTEREGQTNQYLRKL